MKVLPRDTGVLAMGKLETDTDAEEDIQLWWLGLWCLWAFWWGESLWLLLLSWFCPTVQVLGRTIIRAWSDRETRTFDSTSAFRPRFHTTHRNRTHMEMVDAVCHQSIGAGMQREDMTDRNESDRSKEECVRWSPNGLCQRQVKEKYPAHVMMLGSPYPVRPTRKSEISFIYEAT